MRAALEPISGFSRFLDRGWGTSDHRHGFARSREGAKAARIRDCSQPRERRQPRSVFPAPLRPCGKKSPPPPRATTYGILPQRRRDAGKTTPDNAPPPCASAPLREPGPLPSPRRCVAAGKPSVRVAAGIHPAERDNGGRPVGLTFAPEASSRSCGSQLLRAPIANLRIPCAVTASRTPRHPFKLPRPLTGRTEERESGQVHDAMPRSGAVESQRFWARKRFVKWIDLTHYPAAGVSTTFPFAGTRLSRNDAMEGRDRFTRRRGDAEKGHLDGRLVSHRWVKGSRRWNSRDRPLSPRSPRLRVRLLLHGHG